VKDVGMVAAMGHPGGARNQLDARFLSQFSVFEIQFPSTVNLRTIYSAILEAHVALLSEDVKRTPLLLVTIVEENGTRIE
jgi:dynein heavy chain, axonemal